jgi:hypothetical protein
MAKRGRWLDPKEIEVREMRDAERILGIIEDRGRPWSSATNATSAFTMDA